MVNNMLIKLTCWFKRLQKVLVYNSSVPIFQYIQYATGGIIRISNKSEVCVLAM